ncbi:MAG: DnaB-like helicase C-terminal domain-containing protein [Planctomycetota bacterium]|nr:DnaB-like helicase C-terminal domain-containing protein [Planctomycetota bacterium]
MQHLADLLATIPLPELPEDGPPNDASNLLEGHSLCTGDLVQDLGAGLPEGHLHVWGGPSGAGKTAFLLCLLQGAAAQGRRVVYATYDLSPESLALRLLAMTAGVELRALPDPGGTADQCELGPAELQRAHAAREYLATLPFEVQAARGFSAESLQDRLVRMPYRAGILAVDYLQGVIREPGSEMGVALRQLSDLAGQLHVAVVCAVRAGDEAAAELDEMRERGLSLPDRVGWIAPLAKDGCERRAEVLHNRHGETPAVPLHLDEATGSLGRANA